MKKRFLIPVVFYFIIFSINSQELIFESPVNFAENGTTFQIFDESSHQFVLLIEGKVELSGFYFNQELENKLTFSIQKAKGMDKQLLGGLLNKFDLVLFFTNKKFTELYSLIYNLNTKKGDFKSLDINPTKEKLVTFWSNNFKFNILSIKNGSSILSVREFTFPDSYSIKDFDCSIYRFSLDPKFNKIYDLLRPLDFELEPISRANYSLAAASKPVKIYIQNEKIIIISEKIPNISLALEIDLLKNTANAKGFTHPLLNCEGQLAPKSNSYLLDSILYQFNICKHGFGLTISNFENQEEINQFLVSDTADIQIANSPIIFDKQDQMMIGDRYKNIEKTEKFLRKVSNSDVAVLAAKVENEIQICLGGYKLIGQSTTLYNSHNGMSTSRIPMDPVLRFVFFWSRFNPQKFNHISGLMEGNHVSEINSFLEKIESEYDPDNNMPAISSILSFEISDEYYLCLSIYRTEKIYVYKF